LLLVVVLAAAFGAQAQTNLIVPSRSLWRYSDANEWLGTSWMLPIVDDSRWALGRAPLGYGKPNVSIIREVMTAYFRHSFTLTNAPESWLTLRVRRDDGVIVYLNGAEVFRSNMPTGFVHHFTAALVAVEPDAFVVANVSASFLLSGTNVVAAEVHGCGG